MAGVLLSISKIVKSRLEPVNYLTVSIRGTAKTGQVTDTELEALIETKSTVSRTAQLTDDINTLEAIPYATKHIFSRPCHEPPSRIRQSLLKKGFPRTATNIEANGNEAQ